MVTKENFMQKFGAYANRYSSFMLIDVNVDDVIKVLNEYEDKYKDKLCAGDCIDKGRAVSFTVFKVSTEHLLCYLTSALECIGYADTAWDDYITLAMKNGKEYDGFTARWCDGYPYENSADEFDAFFELIDTVSGEVFGSGAGMVDRETYEYYKKIVDTHSLGNKEAVKQSAEKQIWMIGIRNSESDHVVFKRVLGSKDAVKKHLVHLVKEDMWLLGTHSEDDVIEEDGELCACGHYNGYNIVYTAKPEPDVTELDENGIIKEPVSDSDNKRLVSEMEEKGLTVEVKPVSPGMLQYTVSYKDIPCGTGAITDEGLKENELIAKILRLINADHVVAQMEAMGA